VSLEAGPYDIKSDGDEQTDLESWERCEVVIQRAQKSLIYRALFMRMCADSCVECVTRTSVCVRVANGELVEFRFDGVCTTFICHLCTRINLSL